MRTIGLIGAGDIVRKKYLPLLSERSDCRVRGICSLGGDSARRLAKEFRIDSVFGSYEDLLMQKEIDAVFVCTPPHVSRKIAGLALENGKHVLLEKPFGTNYSEISQLLQQASTGSKTFYTVFNNRFREENQWLIGEVAQGAVGEVELVDVCWYRRNIHASKTWLANPSLSGGGVLMDLGMHMLYLTLLILPDRTRFTAYCCNHKHDLPNSDVEDDTSVGIVSVDDRVEIVLRLGWDMKMAAKPSVNLEVFGTQGHMSNKEFSGSKTDGFRYMIQDFFGCIDKGTNSDLALADDTMMLIDALYESSRIHSPVSGEFSCLGKGNQG